jgi:hypothetical protein
MMVDNELVLSDGQVVTVTALSSVYDMKDAGRMGSGQNIGFRTVVDADFATLTSLAVQVVAGAAANLSDAVVIAQGPVVLAAGLTAGEVIFSGNAVPHSAKYRYWGFKYVVAGSAATTGTVTSQFILDQPDQEYFESGFVV